MSAAEQGQGAEEAPRAPLPPFTEETARIKVQAAEDAWNSRDPTKVSMAYSKDTEWRNRSSFLRGRDEVREFLQGKWDRELDYKLKKHLFAFTDNKIAVHFQYEYRTEDGQWHRAYGNEHWTFDDLGYMQTRNASINDVEIDASERVLATDEPLHDLSEYSSGVKR
ncbi:Hypothetical Protein FCC1311_107332 [Hondaea fermentalgiana]|uniref:Uncharacterized protein n=1 Tax=Hondaea fermentalgiana TaxID=2315210 RepID=A0A2R5GW03_9STRA|nr:Hypothetical Protein FCC1311_107332 [Hondaea fermentalgiana]|eukprot:GBG34509.1 Hypothetical Protein FCC1311_107332 [Hondaea fermentalgiana]